MQSIDFSLDSEVFVLPMRKDTEAKKKKTSQKEIQLLKSDRNSQVRSKKDGIELFLFLLLKV